MSNDDAGQASNVEARKLALEAIATLVNVKKIAADRLLRPAGIPDALIKRFVKGTDATIGDPLTKRQAGASILEALAREGKEGAAVRTIIDIAAEWDVFDLAQDEYKARAVVQKARELKGVLAEAEGSRKSAARAYRTRARSASAEITRRLTSKRKQSPPKPVRSSVDECRASTTRLSP